MQNKATLLRSDQSGYTVRVQFIPLSPAEHERCSKLLKQFQVQQVMATTEGPLSADLYFMDCTPEEQQAQMQREVVPVIRFMTPLEMKTALEAQGFDVIEKNHVPVAVASVPVVVDPASQLGPGDPAAEPVLTDEQKAALNKPDPTDKPA